MKQSNEEYAATRSSLYLKELSGARWREYNRQQTPTFFYTKISLKEEIGFAVDKVKGLTP